jgi:hypothetical protein
MTGRGAWLRLVMAAWVWLCGFPPQSLRVHEAHEGDAADAEGCQQQAKRLRLGPSLAQMLAEREAVPPEFGDAADWMDKTKASNAKLIAYSVLRVEPGQTWDGPLTPWSDEAAFQRSFLGLPLDAYVVKVTHAFDLPAPQQLFTKVGYRGEENSLQVRPDRMVFAPASLTMESMVCREGRLSHQRTEAEPRDSVLISVASLASEFQDKLSEDPLAILLAEPFVKHLLRRGAGDLVLLGHWTPLWPDFPPQRWARSTRQQREPPASRQPVNPASLGWTALALLSCARRFWH